MNTVIIPTDFSPLADTAMQYGAALAQLVHADVLLVNVYTIPATMNDMPAMVISAEELKKAADDGLERCRQTLQTTFPDLQIRTESRLGDDVDELENAYKEHNTYAIVLGTRHVSGVEEILFGDNTITTMRHLKCPIISVSENTAFNPPKTIALATDLLNIDKFPVERITSFLKPLNIALHIVHVAEGPVLEQDKEEAAAQITNKLNTLQPTYSLIKDEDLVHGLQQYVQQHNIDLLMLIPHEHNFIERLLFRLHTKNIVTHMPIPVVSIAE